MIKPILTVACLFTLSFGYMTQNNPGILVSPGNKLVTKEVVCSDDTMGFTLVITSSSIENNLVYFSCDDPEMKGLYEKTDNSGTEPAGADNLIINRVEYFSREFDSGASLTYEQAEEFCSDLGGRIPTNSEISGAFSSNKDDLKTAYKLDGNEMSSEFWTSSVNADGQGLTYQIDGDSFVSDTGIKDSGRFNVKCVK